MIVTCTQIWRNA